MWRTVFLIRFAIVVAFIVFAIGFCPRAFAVVDQQLLPSSWTNEGNVGAGNGIDWTQTFTVGVTGQLIGFDVAVGRNSVVVQPLLYDIRRTVGGVATQDDTGPNVLVSGTVSAQAIPVVPPLTPQLPLPSLTHIDVSSAALSVTAGDLLAIVLRSDDPGLQISGGRTYSWYGLSTDINPYTGGAAFYRFGDSGWVDQSGIDMVFQTEVTPVPEPSTLVLLAFGGVIALAASRRHRCELCGREIVNDSNERPSGWAQMPISRLPDGSVQTALLCDLCSTKGEAAAWVLGRRQHKANDE